MATRELGPGGRTWQEVLAPYKRPDSRKAMGQLLSSLIPFAVVWWLMLRSLEVSYGLTLLLALPMAGLFVRIFIIQHDCGHYSFFKSRAWNNWTGRVLGVLTLTPYEYWQRTHAIHHATHGDLDRRELGDISTLTVREYRRLPWYRKLAYRIYRNIFVMLVIGPIYQFVLKHRLPWDAPLTWKREWASVMYTNLALGALVALGHYTIGVEKLLLIHLPIWVFGGALGIWLFYIQHQFEDTYWRNGAQWSFDAAGLEGSSFYDLPAILHWFTGNIGYHHIHHLASRIPNYRLKECMDGIPDLYRVNRITLMASLRCAGLKLWDEDSGKLVGFGHLRSIRV